MSIRHGVEVSFALGPDSLARAEEVAARLSALAAGVERETLFIDEAAGIYGYLGEWIAADPADRFATDPDLVALAAGLVNARGGPATVRRYTMRVGGFGGG